jgi:hypothetical protein
MFNTRSAIFSFLAIICGLCNTSVSCAQIIFDGTATWSWEASIDGGATWHRGLFDVPASQRDVRVRSSLSFPPPTGLGGGFSTAELDGVVHGAGPLDSISQLSGGNLLSGNFVASRFGSTLKIDDPVDTLPPGLGPRWAVLAQSRNQTGRSLANPIILLSYTLSLDGTSGDRVIDGIFRQRPDYPLGHVVSIDMGRNEEAPTLVPFLIQEPLTIRVVPSPATLVVGLLGLAIASRRRSGR